MKIKYSIIKKMLVLGIIILLFGVSTISALNTNVESTKMIEYIENLNPKVETFYPTDDVLIKHEDPNRNCNWDYFETRNEYGAFGTPGFEYDGLLKFDISSIPPSAIIDSAKLNIYYFRWRDNNPVGRPLRLYRIMNNWDEDIVTWNTQPSYAAQQSASSSVPGYFGWMIWEVTNDVQDFVNGQEVNYGWKVTDDNYWGQYDVPTASFRPKEYGSFIPYLVVEIGTSPSNPPYTPTIDGPTSGKKGISYVFTANTTDPDGDKIYYLFSWGDGTESGWGGPYNSGSTAYESHIWTELGTFIVKVKASDVNGAVSDWSEPLLIKISRTKIIVNPLLRFFENHPLLYKMMQMFFK